MSFQQGLSGLNGAAKSLDVIGNNIANASTVGFKGSTAQFADVYAKSLNGAGGNSPGIGTKVAAIAQQFVQGNVEASNNPLDIAINGAGFFRVEAAGVVQYSRNGQFSVDKDGYIINAQSAKLTGYGVNANGQIVAGSPGPLKIDTSDLAPKASKNIKFEIQLDSRSTVPPNTPFDPNDSDTYNYQSPLTVYDTLGNSHAVSAYYVKTGPGQWDVYATSDTGEITKQKVAAAATGTGAPFAAVNAARTAWEAATKVVPPVQADITAALAAYATAASAMVTAAAGAAGGTAANQTEIAAAAAAAAAIPGATPGEVDAAMAGAIKVPPVAIGKLAFDTNGSLNKTLTGTAGKFDVTLPLFPSTGAELTLPVTIDFNGSTQYGTTTNEKTTKADGFKAGVLQRFTTGGDGVILGQYDNGETRPLGQVVLANFTNPNGLEPLGNNAWAETSDSGGPMIGTPDSGGLGVLNAGATEASSVDLTAELVNMITAQRVYQANAQTIKTQDSVLQTLVNLR
ncbi:flagellar hook protein FlgE [Massilia niastensis]|uniref:flagellar hook protein FlgE n=1 Tax=Massilia niastensis TaxID=544911 RepID=UPI0003A5FD91|nr:flagellar hook protein FlgE [Massilia niastensis]